MNFVSEAEKRKDTIIENLKEIVAIPTLLDETTKSEHAPFGKAIREGLDWILDKASNDGFRVVDVDGYAGAIIYGDHEETVSMLGHLDVVPVGEGWTRDPFGGEIEDGYIFGRGVSDDKGPTIAAYEAMKMVRDSKLPLTRNLMLIVGCDEETKMRCIEYYKEHGPKSNFGFVPDASFPVIYGEKNICVATVSGKINSVIASFKAGERPNVVIGKAVCTLKGDAKTDEFSFFLASQALTGTAETENGYTTYTINGKNAHGSMPDHGVNAGVHMLSFIGAAYQDDFCLQAYKLFKDYYGDGLGIKFNGVYMGPLTMNLGIINIANGQAEFTIDIRYPNDYPSETLINAIEAACLKSNTGCRLAHTDISEGLFADPNGFLVTNLMDAYRQVTHDNFTPPMTMGGGTYARHYPNHVAFGMEFPNRAMPDFVGGFHELDEGIALDDLVEASAIYATALYNLAK